MKKLGIVIMMAMVAAATVQAETLALWELDNLAVNSSNATVNTTHPDMSSTDLAAGAGLDTAIAWPNALGGYADWRLGPNLQYAIDTGDDYFTTTLTADAGKMVSYSNLFARFAVNAGDDGAYLTFHLLSDKTGFTTNDVLGSFTVDDTRIADWTSITYTNDFDLSTVSELQGVQGDTEFRIYVTATNGNRMAIGHDSWLDPLEDDLRFDGIVEVATSAPPAVVVELAKWDLDDLAMNQSTGAVDWVNADMSSSDLIAQPGGFSTAIAWPNAMGGFADWHLGGSLEWTLQNAPNYFTITLAPGSGKQVSYDNLFARFAVNAGDDGAYVQFHLLSDKTGFTTNNVLGTFTVEDTVAPNYNSIIYTYEFDLSEVAELQDLTEAIEFRIYATATNGNRMAIGHNHFTQGSDDLVVNGSIDDLPYVPATILSWTSISDSVMKLVIDAPADPALYYPKATTDLTLGFSGVPHSDNAAGPFTTITNLSYSTPEGDNEAIYVETTEAAKFFGIGEE